MVYIYILICAAHDMPQPLKLLRVLVESAQLAVAPARRTWWVVHHHGLLAWCGMRNCVRKLRACHSSRLLMQLLLLPLLLHCHLDPICCCCCSCCCCSSCCHDTTLLTRQQCSSPSDIAWHRAAVVGERRRSLCNCRCNNLSNVLKTTITQ